MSEAEGFLVEAPGKVILHGEHAVVYGKRAIAVSVGLYTRLRIRPTKEGVEIQFPEVGIHTKLSLSDLQDLKVSLGPDFKYSILNESPEIRISEKVKSVLDSFSEAHADLKDSVVESLKPAQKAAFQAFLFLYSGILDEVSPYSFVIETDLPVGAGLGSSASFGVALAGGILLAAGREPKHGFNVDTVNRWAFVSEKFVHGSPSGVDNSVASFGGGIVFRKGDPLQHIPNCPDIRVLLVNTKVPRSTKALIATVMGLREGNPDLFQRTMDAIDGVVGECVSEIERTREASPALVARNQELLVTLGVSHPALQLIVQLAAEHGMSAKLTGAGGGGCAFIPIPTTASQDSVQPLLSALAEKDFQVWDTILGCKGFHLC